MITLTDQIIDWQKVHGRHGLPWQIQPTPYRVWVSEIMLQQTQVKTVIPYYLRFMKSCPDVSDLANLPIDKLMLLWQGLGYYSRARNLHKTADIIDQQGYFPDTLDELIQLPGIGPSTAAAILSLAYNQPHAILDGNVKRIFSRYYGIDLPPPKSDKILWEHARANIPLEPRSYTQGLMDLGASLCSRQKPQCEICPLQNNCYAYLHHQTDILPVKKKNIIKQEVHLYIVLSLNNKKIGLQRRPNKGIWAKLYTPYILDSKDQVPEKSFPLKPYKHVLTHRILHIHPYYTFTEYPDLVYSDINHLEYAIPTGIKSAITQLVELLK